MKIGIIGSGNVGSALGKIWAEKGHEVMFSSRHPEKSKALAQSVGNNASSGLPVEAVKFGDVVLLAVPWTQAENALRSAGSLDGKILIDCTNPLKPDFSGLAIGLTTSAGEEDAKIAKGARVVKAFNTTFAVLMASESRLFGEVSPTGFYCGGDAAAKAVVSDLIKDTGLEPVDAGPLEMARCLEPLAFLMMDLGFNQKMGTDIAFHLLKR
jgi:8-hydroxy-5-deazaflavin:NADPH oxidoreductase